MILTETWFNGSIQDSEYFSPSSTIHRRDRNSKTPGGGLIIAVNSSIISSREEGMEPANKEIMWVKVNVNHCKTLYVGACYRPEISDTETIETLDISLQKITNTDNKIVLLGGDFNFPGWNWKQNTHKTPCAYPSLHTKFYDVLCNNGLTQIVEEPTRGDNTLDLIITNRPKPNKQDSSPSRHQ